MTSSPRDAFKNASTVVPLNKPNMLLGDLLPLLEKRYKLHLPAVHVQFHLLPDDRKGLKHTSGVLRMDQDVRALAVEAV